jgi:outer membrane protein assembly factor BamB
MWGLSGSPLVVDGVVVVYGGGPKQNNLLAYSAETGAPKWTASAGGGSYASPQLATIAGRTQILMHSDGGLASVDPADGHELWIAGAAMPGAPCSLQAHVLEGGLLFGGTLTGMGAGALQAVRSGDSWKIEDRWSSTTVKPEFSDYVLHRGLAYGFDGAIFCCVDPKEGTRRWKGGRYGRGQVILLADQSLLLVLGEKGEVVLLSARPDRHEELARIQALEGVTWNHPVIAHGRLYVRNAKEIACFELPTAKRE